MYRQENTSREQLKEKISLAFERLNAENTPGNEDTEVVSGNFCTTILIRPSTTSYEFFYKQKSTNTNL